MRLVIQRVSKASVEIEGKVNGKIDEGFMVLIGITNDDNKVVEKMADKLINLRIFEDENEKLNLSLMDVKGEILSISQFTLYANCKKGRRPSFWMQQNLIFQNPFMNILMNILKKEFM